MFPRVLFLTNYFCDEFFATHFCDEYKAFTLGIGIFVILTIASFRIRVPTKFFLTRNVCIKLNSRHSEEYGETVAAAAHTGFFWKFSFGNSNVEINEFWCKIGLKTWESTSVH